MSKDKCENACISDKLCVLFSGATSVAAGGVTLTFAVYTCNEAIDLLNKAMADGLGLVLPPDVWSNLGISASLTIGSAYIASFMAANTNFVAQHFLGWKGNTSLNKWAGRVMGFAPTFMAASLGVYAVSSGVDSYIAVSNLQEKNIADCLQTINSKECIKFLGPGLTALVSASLSVFIGSTARSVYKEVVELTEPEPK